MEIKTFDELWKLYQSNHLSTYEPQTIRNRLELAKFFDELLDIPISDFEPQLISNYLTYKKTLFAKIKNNSKRRSFDNEIKLLRAIFNWYKENFNYMFVNPVIKSHWKLSRIVSDKKEVGKMSQLDIERFLSALDKGVYQDAAIFQFLLALRIQEAAGIQLKDISLGGDPQVEIKNVVIWGPNKKFERLKSKPKNGEIRTCYLSDELVQIVRRRQKESHPNCNFLFHDGGQPLAYRAIQYRYNKALKKIGLYGEFSSTHFIRHAMATMARREMGSLEAVQAVTGHKDQKLVQHYAQFAPSEMQKNAVIQISKKLNLADPYLSGSKK
jgi:integrase